MAINSRKKGRRGEKKARLVLTKWTKLEFAGVPASGGLRWKKTDNITGDLVCTDPLHRFDFSIEVKNHREINFEHLLTPNINSSIKEFWKQCKMDAIRGKKIPLLMMRYDGIRPSDYFFLVISLKLFKRLKPILKLKYPYIKCIRNGFVILHPDILFKTSYHKIKIETQQIIKEIWN